MTIFLCIPPLTHSLTPCTTVHQTLRPIREAFLFFKNILLSVCSTTATQNLQLKHGLKKHAQKVFLNKFP